ncbi:MAG TPA: pyridoxal 5'-phosphate synthase [Candidatus Binataceae bacterium]|nr:pyridoxal 5'-phosphate synthase [Candidatus Binataceae bacterium]
MSSVHHQVHEFVSTARKEYKFGELNEQNVAADPIIQFGNWMREAIDAQVDEPHAMTLATADHAGNVSARIVLLRGVDERGFAFYTNYESHKGRDLAGNPRAALVFHWKSMERQVRIAGPVARISRMEPLCHPDRRLPGESRPGEAGRSPERSRMGEGSRRVRAPQPPLSQVAPSLYRDNTFSPTNQGTPSESD